MSSFSVRRDGAIAYTYSGPKDAPDLYLRQGANARNLTDVNAALLRGKQLAEVESFTFISNDNKFEVEAFLTKPVGMDAGTDISADRQHPRRPARAAGPGVQFKNQIYAARGWATLMVNYRGSTGYGQAFADAVFRDQNGNEGQDVLYGFSAAMRRYPWIDRDRLGVEGTSYGGQLSDVADHADQHLQGGDPDRGDHRTSSATTT